jgi:hypothetical protein
MMQRRNSKQAALIAFKFLALALVLLTYSRSYAQVAGATLSGAVTDQSGGAVPQAAISISNIATGITRAGATSSGGFYSVPDLLPGKYEVKASTQGFSSELRTGINLTMAEQQVPWLF